MIVRRTPHYPAPPSDGLGIVPLLIAGAVGGGAVLTTALTWLGWNKYTAAQEEAKKYEAYKATLPAPAALPARVAPQTVEQMTVGGQWTPDIEAQQYNATFRDRLSHALDNVPVLPPDDETNKTSPWVYAAIGTGVVLLAVAAGRR